VFVGPEAEQVRAGIRSRREPAVEQLADAISPTWACIWRAGKSIPPCIGGVVETTCTGIPGVNGLFGSVLAAQGDCGRRTIQQDVPVDMPLVSQERDWSDRDFDCSTQRQR
jgi:hypothetical protein